MTAIPIGTWVHLRPVTIDLTGKPAFATEGHVLRGILAKVTKILEDAKGTYYKVETRTGRIRYVRRDGIESIHRKRPPSRAEPKIQTMRMRVRSAAYIAKAATPTIADWLPLPELEGCE